MKSPTPWIISIILAVVAILGWGGYLIERAETTNDAVSEPNPKQQNGSAQNNQNLESKFATLEQDYRSLQVENTGLISLNSDLKQRHERLKNQIGELTNRNIETDELVTELRAAIVQSNQAAESALSQNADQTAAAVQAINATLKKQTEDLEKEKAMLVSLLQESEQIGSLVATLEQRVDAMIDEPAANASDTASDLKQVASSLEDTVVSLQTKLDDLKQASDASTAAMTERSAMPAVVLNGTTQYSPLQTDREYISQRLKHSTGHLRRLRAKLRMQEEMLQRMREQMQMEKSRADENENRLNEQLLTTANNSRTLFESNRDLRLEVEALTNRIEELVPQLQQQGKLLTEKDQTILANELLVRELDEAIRSLKQDHSVQLAEFELQISEIHSDFYVITVANDILFDSGSAALTNEGKQALTLIFDTLIAHGDRLISLEGHTDNVPITANLATIYPTNWELSAARATSAARFLIGKGLPAESVRAVAFGETRPIDTNENEAGRTRNRRLEILLSPPLESVDNAQS